MHIRASVRTLALAYAIILGAISPFAVHSHATENQDSGSTVSSPGDC
jgi:hypothetical protein